MLDQFNNTSTAPTPANSTPKFDIRLHLDKLSQDGGKQTKTEGSYLCPVCGAKNFKVNLRTGKYNTFSCSCAHTEQGKRKIRDAIAPLTWEKPPRPKQKREWLYFGADGQKLIKVHREDDGEGGRRIWQAAMQPGKSPTDLQGLCQPYRYKDCLEAIAAGQLVLWVEGEALADLLWGLGLAATTTIRGCGAYSSEQYRGLFPADRLIICPDRDQPGIKYAEAIAADYPEARWLYAFPQSYLWQRLPESKGADIADWIEDGATVEDILSAIEPGQRKQVAPPAAIAPGATDEISTELRQEIQVLLQLGKNPPKAADLLPSLASPFEGLARLFNVPEAAFVGMLLPMAASQIPAKLRLLVSPETSHRAPPILNVALVAESGSLKSPIIDAVHRPLKVMQGESFERYLSDKKEFTRASKQYDALPKNEKADADEPEAPKLRTHYFEDATTEAIAKGLSQQPGTGAAIVLDELAGFFQGMDQYRSGGKGNDRQRFLTAYNGGAWHIQRKSSDPMFIETVSLSITGTIQPSALRKQIGADAEETDGQWARWLFINLPISMMPPPGDGPSIDCSDRLESIYRALNQFPAEGDLCFGAEARKLWREWHIWTETQKMAELSPLLRAIYPKIREQAARIALIAHCVEEAAAGKITPIKEIAVGTLKAAIAFARHCFENARALFAGFGATSDDPEAARIARFAEKFAGQEIDHRKARSFLPKTNGKIADKAACCGFLGSLCAAGVAIAKADDFSRIQILDPSRIQAGSGLDPAWIQAQNQDISTIPGSTVDLPGSVDPNLDPTRIQAETPSQQATEAPLDPWIRNPENQNRPEPKEGDPVEVWDPTIKDWINGRRLGKEHPTQTRLSHRTGKARPSFYVTDERGGKRLIARDDVRSCSETKAIGQHSEATPIAAGETVRLRVEHCGIKAGGCVRSLESIEPGAMRFVRVADMQGRELPETVWSTAIERVDGDW